MYKVQEIGQCLIETVLTDQDIGRQTIEDIIGYEDDGETELQQTSKPKILSKMK
jgi:hypothetical protein